MGEETELFVMKGPEIKRLQVIEKAIERKVRQSAAAEVLGISERQVRRLVGRVRSQGARGVIHGLRGKASNRKLSAGLRQRVLKVYQASYGDFGPTLAQEKLESREGLKVSKETLRVWLLSSGLWQQRRRTPARHLRWRERKGHAGEMVQVDGSHHAWLEERGPELVLMGWIDDATSRTYGRFYEYEGTKPAIDSLKRYIHRYGIPASVYVDRHTTYKSWSKDSVAEELKGESAKSHFEKACEKLGIRVIHAYSPQAKGRVERLFKTWQDRLVKELRLSGAKTLAEANVVLGRFLGGYNRRYCVPAREKADLHRPWPKGIKPEEVFAVHTDRRLRNDNTIVHEGQWYQVLTKARVPTVTVREGIEGRLELLANGEKLKYQEIPGPLPKISQPAAPKAPRRPPIPAANHPWRNRVAWQS